MSQVSIVQDRVQIQHDKGQLFSNVDSICTYCHFHENNFPSTTVENSSGGINKRVAQLKEGVVEGCWLCQALLAAMQLWRDYDAKTHDKMINFSARYDVERFLVLGKECFPSVQIYCPEGKPQALRFVTDKEISTTAFSQSCRDFISQNLRRCIETHTACRQSQVRLRESLGGDWPKRMLRIDKRNNQVRLVAFDTSMTSKYMALSYCWGSQKGHLRATAETLPRLREGVSISSLPRTLEDAVQVVIGLGSDLIWIDSVCIVQDDPRDLNEEAGKMGSVYAQALLTIIAKSSSTCDEGFLDKRRQESIHLASVIVDDQPTEVRARVVHDWGHHRGRNHPYGPRSRVDPVDKRAWTLQEMLLSTRYVSFTSGEVQWGCQALKDCECGQPLYGGLDRLQDTQERWFAIVEEYSNRLLTMHTDKLTALAGIARKFSVDLKGQQYAAGIWVAKKRANDLSAQGLLWYRGRYWEKGANANITSVPTTYTAPTYSWASITGQVGHHGSESSKDYRFLTKVLDAVADYASPDEFGRVSGGFIRLVGPLLQAKIRPWDMDNYPYLAPETYIKGINGGFYYGCLLDVPLEKITLEDGSYSVRRRRNALSSSTEIERTTEGGFEEETDVCILPIRSILNPKISPNSPSKDNFFVNCLVLARSNEHGGYERIGIYDIYDKQDFVGLPVTEVCIY